MSDVSYGFRAFLPLPRAERKGVALCLSGGGYRAALFHLGALRRLNELGVLSRVDTISSVSGGSVMAATVAAHLIREPAAWGTPGGAVAGFDEGIAEPMRTLSEKDIRTRAILERLKPWRWLDQNAQVDVLVSELESSGIRGTLADLPVRPRFVLCATDLVLRDQWIFDGGERRVGETALGYSGAVERWPLARAAAASACFPVAFSPMKLDLAAADLTGGTYAEPDRDSLAGRVELSDGGLYDNLGLEPVWRDHAAVLVSDGAPAFRPEPGIGRLWGQLRPAVTLLEQATYVRVRWLIAGFLARQLDGSYWAIGSDPANFPFRPAVAPYSHALVRDRISQVRIDFDVFSEGERAALENHGYLMAEIAVKAHAPALMTGDPGLRVPYPDWMDEAKVGEALRASHRTRIFRRRLRR